MVLKGRLQKKKHMAGEKYGVERRKNRKGGAMRNNSIMREKTEKL